MNTKEQINKVFEYAKANKNSKSLTVYETAKKMIPEVNPKAYDTIIKKICKIIGI